MTIDVDSINGAVSELFPGSRNRCVEIGESHALARVDVADSDLRPGGFISGPTQFGLLDAAFWYATFVGLDRFEPMAMTSELSVRYLRPALGTALFCRAEVESVSRRSVVLSGRTWTDSNPDKTTAIAQGTYAIPLPR